MYALANEREEWKTAGQVRSIENQSSANGQSSVFDCRVGQNNGNISLVTIDFLSARAFYSIICADLMIRLTVFNTRMQSWCWFS
jgi:hypothetical protein